VRDSKGRFHQGSVEGQLLGSGVAPAQLPIPTISNQIFIIQLAAALLGNWSNEIKSANQNNNNNQPKEYLLR